MKPKNIGHHGLRLEGISATGYWGFLSNRFIKVGKPGGRLEMIAAATEYTMEHYWAKPSPHTGEGE